jgi:AcrR family transcriptional regulator
MLERRSGASSTKKTARRLPGRPRSELKRQAILAAAYDLLVKVGMAELTIDAIAQRSKVAKATIYRWWPSKGLVAMEGFLAAIRPRINYPEGGSAIADIKAQFMRTARLYSGKNGKIMAGLIAQGHSDPEIEMALVTGFILPRRREVEKTLLRGIERGELRPGLDIDTVIDAIYGPLYLRLMIDRGAFDDKWAARVIDIAFQGIVLNRTESQTVKVKR